MADDIIVFVAANCEAVQVAPWEEAANALGAVFCVVDVYRTDAQRLTAYLRLFSPRAVLGLVDELIIGLLDSGLDPVELFAATSVVAARPKARRRLGELGISARLWQHLGPAVAVECRVVDGAHVEQVWNPTLEEGRIVLNPSPELALGPEQIDTTSRGTLTEEPCACGTPGPRLLLDP